MSSRRDIKQDFSTIWFVHEPKFRVTCEDISGSLTMAVFQMVRRLLPL